MQLTHKDKKTQSSYKENKNKTLDKYKVGQSVCFQMPAHVAVGYGDTRIPAAERERGKTFLLRGPG